MMVSEITGKRWQKKCEPDVEKTWKNLSDAVIFIES